MKNLIICSSLLVAVSIACQHAQVEPAQAISGTYQAQQYNRITAYPINGQTLSLQISAVTADTARVEIRPSVPNGTFPGDIYSPAQPLIYPKAYVERDPNGATYLYLTGKPTSPTSYADNQIWLYSDGHNADYIFTPKQTPHFSVEIRFVKQ